MVATLPRIDASERRARLAVRHHLAPASRAADPVTASGDVVGLHATDPMTVYLAAAARTASLTMDASAWLGPVRVVPRFRTPVETELAG